MRIAWFSHRYWPCIGGAETYSQALVKRFVADGVQADVFTSDADELWYFTNPRRRRLNEPARAMVDGACVRRFAVRHVPGQRYLGRLLSYAPHWPTRCRFESYMPILPGIERVRGPYDAVFAVGFPFTVFALAALKTARAAGAPLVITPFLHLSTPGDAVSRHYTRAHQKWLLRQADVVVSPTRLESEVVAGWGVPPERRMVLPMAIDRDRVTGGDGPAFRARHGIPATCRLAGQLGALDPNKGTCDLVRAIHRLNQARDSDQAIHLVLAGAASPDFEAFLAGWPGGRPGWLHVTGPLPCGDVPAFYDAIDVFAMPSRTDSFGIVYLEAWANAKPVVAAAAGGVVEVVRDGVNGLLAPFGDIERLSTAVGRILADPALAGRLAAAGAAQVAAGHTWDDRYQELRARLADGATDSAAGRPPKRGPVAASR